MSNIKHRLTTMLANYGNTLLAAVFHLQTKDKNRADYIWTKDEEFEHLMKVSKRYSLETGRLAKDLKVKVIKGIDTDNDWRELYDTSRDMEFYLQLLIKFSMSGSVR